MNFLTKGKRGIIYKRGNTIIKVKNPESKAKYRIQNEAKYLKLLNKYNIGPRFISYSKGRLKMEFVKGDFIIGYIKKNNKKDIIKILRDVLKQCFVMDKLRINKLEMHHPLKHIIVGKNPILIDFERCYKTDNPKNAPQFIQFIISKNLNEVLLKKKIKINRKKMIGLAIRYKGKINEENFNNILH